jgi:hypothetical protein
VEIISSPTAIDCNDVMPGFSLQMSKIWWTNVVKVLDRARADGIFLLVIDYYHRCKLTKY